MENTGIELDLTNARWRRSARSSGNGNCVEIAAVKGVKDGQRQPMIAMRDSKNPEGPVLGFTQAEWSAFLGGTRDGDFDDLT